ncbi:hypothetical protein BKA65DRAFT_569356 [Rhexocercosporidium sp. MPI-PUGE-AT-0058]|nr:hypothetical protein BKA65DRAFT_569356 [Rhexocercosporidium sp. MPI-PUGE-AT-0058]
MCIDEDCMDWNDDCLTIYGYSAARNTYALSSWPKPGKIAIKKEGGDFDILVNRLQRGRLIWVCQAKSGKPSAIDISRTEKLWDARTLVFDSHQHSSAHMPLPRICQGKKPDDWSAGEKSGAMMVRGRMTHALQKLVEEGEYGGWLEMTMQLEGIIRKGMAKKAETYRDEHCDRCRHKTTFWSTKMLECSLEEDYARELAFSDVSVLDLDPEDLDLVDMDAAATYSLLRKLGPDRYSGFVDYDPKRKNKKICFRSCHVKACTAQCSIDLNKIRKSWFKRAPKSKPEPVKEEQPAIFKLKPRRLIRTRPCPPGWEIHSYFSAECNRQSWNSFRCTDDRCPKSYPGCPHAFIKPGRSSKGDNDPFKAFHSTEGLIYWKDLFIPSFGENEDWTDNERRRKYNAYKENREKIYEQFRNTPAPPVNNTSSPKVPCTNQRQSKQ